MPLPPLEPRPEFATTLAGLRPPCTDYQYFTSAERYPLAAAGPEYATSQACWLADACMLTYGDADFIERAFEASPLPGQQWQLEWLGERRDNSGIVLRSPQLVVVALRGTRVENHQPLPNAELVLLNTEDFRTDRQFLTTADSLGGRVHQGFLNAFQRIQPDLKAVLSASAGGPPCRLTGHSLGGALATLAAAYLPELSGSVVYTFGSPRVGNDRFAANAANCVHHRVVNGADWIPRIPPTLLGYVHSGTERTIGQDHDLPFTTTFANTMTGIAEVVQTFASQRRVDMGDWQVTVKGLVDHAPIAYANQLWNQLVMEQSTMPPEQPQG